VYQITRVWFSSIVDHAQQAICKRFPGG